MEATKQSNTASGAKAPSKTTLSLNKKSLNQETESASKTSASKSDKTLTKVKTSKAAKASIEKQTKMTISQDQRRQLIETAAYLRAEQRGFSGGDPMDDWLQAESEVDAMLS